MLDVDGGEPWPFEHEAGTSEQVTRLYRITPADFESWGRESLISFIVRLSREHLVNPRLLIQRIFSEVDPQIALVCRNRFYVKDSRTINAVGEYARIFSTASSRLTGHASLNQLTMLPWKDVLPENGEVMTAKRLKWCPCCLAEQALTLGYNYHPLVWSMELYKACLRHSRPLQETCPRCEKPQPFIPSFPALGHCSHCGASLLSMSTSAPAVANDNTVLKMESTLWSMMQCRQDHSPSLELFRNNLTKLIQLCANGNKAKFCRDLGWDSWAVNSWLRKGQRPTLQRLVVLSIRHNVQIASLFVENDIDGLADAQQTQGHSKRVERKVRPQLLMAQRNAIALRLNEELSNPLPKSVNAMGRELRIGRSALKYWFPELCHALGERYREFLGEVAVRARADRLKILNEILDKFVAEGWWPSKRAVDRELSRHGLALVRTELASTYQQFMSQLGKN